MVKPRPSSPNVPLDRCYSYSQAPYPPPTAATRRQTPRPCSDTRRCEVLDRQMGGGRVQAYSAGRMAGRARSRCTCGNGRQGQRAWRVNFCGLWYGTGAARTYGVIDRLEKSISSSRSERTCGDGKRSVMCRTEGKVDGTKWALTLKGCWFSGLPSPTGMEVPHVPQNCHQSGPTKCVKDPPSSRSSKASTHIMLERLGSKLITRQAVLSLFKLDLVPWRCKPPHYPLLETMRAVAHEVVPQRRGSRESDGEDCALAVA
jgi:hypothetical protein